MIFIAASMSRADRSAILVSAISLTWALVTEPTLSVSGLEAPLATPAAFFSRSEAGGVLEHEVEGTIFVHGDLDWDDLTHLVLRGSVVRLAEVHDVHAMGTQDRAELLARIGLASLDLELDQRRDFLLWSHVMVLLSMTR